MPFREIAGAIAIVTERGVTRVAVVCALRGALYARLGSGFVRLYSDSSTSRPGMRVEELHFDGALYRCAYGRLFHEPSDDRVAFERPPPAALLSVAE